MKICQQEIALAGDFLFRNQLIIHRKMGVGIKKNMPSMTSLGALEIKRNKQQAP